MQCDCLGNLYTSKECSVGVPVQKPTGPACVNMPFAPTLVSRCPYFSGESTCVALTCEEHCWMTLAVNEADTRWTVLLVASVPPQQFDHLCVIIEWWVKHICSRTIQTVWQWGLSYLHMKHLGFPKGTVPFTPVMCPFAHYALYFALCTLHLRDSVMKYSTVVVQETPSCAFVCTPCVAHWRI